MPRPARLDVSVTTVARLLRDIGPAWAAHHDRTIRNVRARHIRCDEMWSFCYAKRKHVTDAKTQPPEAGDVWTALDPDTKLIVSWLVGGRTLEDATEFMDDLQSRLASRVQLTTDGHVAYPEAVEHAFGADVDYGQLVKSYYGRVEEDERRYSPSPWWRPGNVPSWGAPTPSTSGRHT